MTRYRVTHGAVTVQTAVTEGGARAWVDVPPGRLLPADVPADEVAALLRQDRIRPVSNPAAEDPPGVGGEGSGNGPDGMKRPARSASKADWVAYADSQDPGDHESMTKEQLIEQYGQNGGED